MRDRIREEGAGNPNPEEVHRQIDLLGVEHISTDQVLESINTVDPGFELDDTIFTAVDFSDQNMAGSSMASVISTVDADLDFLGNESEWRDYRDPLFSHPPSTTSERARKPSTR